MTSPSENREDAAQADIFLCHSGEQKNFVENLCEALERANHTVFVGKHTLEEACDFPPNILRAIHGCKLGVLVLSQDFMISRWPMSELAEMIQQEIRLLPLFFMLSTRDFESEENICNWRNNWNKLPWYLRQEDLWKMAVKRLTFTNGEVYQEQEGENAYIKRVVATICKLFPSHPMPDLSSIRGHDYLVQATTHMFDMISYGKSRWEKPCMVGLAAAAGIGKTTLCKIMVNFYRSPYCGRSCHIEFPDDCDKSKVVQACKMALKKLDILSEYILDRTEDFDEVVRLMKEHVRKIDVFLAIDNIREDSEDMARSLMGVGFTAASKVLLTGRTAEVLVFSLAHHTQNRYIAGLPTLNHKDAFQIFQDSVDRGDLAASPISNEIRKDFSFYAYGLLYGPGALKVLGKLVRVRCRRDDHWNLDMTAQEWSKMMEEIKDIVGPEVQRILGT